ncbi:hypothetical protein [Escherichia sp. E4736]|uniref:hypothetical protein n=1 Tax=Escherichia sp. E4736 TaxID=2044466 RepID=UPI0010FDC05F|nr:hypothetical protein [Escherichia sp. E4736]TLI90753.1 hypothetical protein FEK46_18255 [Escherichia sp. E4736]
MKKFISVVFLSVMSLSGCKDESKNFSGVWKLTSNESSIPYLLEINCDKACHIISRTLEQGEWDVKESDWSISGDTLNNSGSSLTFKDGRLYNGGKVYSKIRTNNVDSMMREKEREEDKKRDDDFMKKLEG